MTDSDSNISDEELLKNAKSGCKNAFDIFYKRHKIRILNYVYRMIGNLESAEDIAQEVFVKAYVNLLRYTEEGKPLNWVYTIARNLCKNFLRNRRLKRQYSLDKKLDGKEGLSLKDVISSEGTSPLDIATDKELEYLVQTHINKLPLIYREAVILCDIQGCSYEEASHILKCRVGSIGSRLSRARAILAKTLGKYYLGKYNK